MVDERVVIHALHLVGNHTAVGRHFAAFALQLHVEAVACMAVEERQACMVEAAVAALPDEDAVVARAEQMRFLHLIEAEVRAVVHQDFDDLVREEAALACCPVGNDNVVTGKGREGTTTSFPKTRLISSP